MASLNERKRKGKGKFFMNAKKAKYAICPGQRGFLGYCNKFERESIKEARILFDEYSLKINKDQDEEKSDESEVDEFDAADAEQEEMKKQSEQARCYVIMMNFSNKYIRFSFYSKGWNYEFCRKHFLIENQNDIAMKILSVLVK